MNKPANSTRWYQPFRRVEARPQDDPADLGTCFGLELTLACEPAPTKTGATRRAGWMQRLTSKRRAAV